MRNSTSKPKSLTIPPSPSPIHHLYSTHSYSYQLIAQVPIEVSVFNVLKGSTITVRNTRCSSITMAKGKRRRRKSMNPNDASPSSIPPSQKQSQEGCSGLVQISNLQSTPDADPYKNTGIRHQGYRCMANLGTPTPGTKCTHQKQAPQAIHAPTLHIFFPPAGVDAGDGCLKLKVKLRQRPK